jgi:hypothetical protein
MRANGRPSDVHVATYGNGGGMEIHHGFNGGRQVVVVRGDGSHVFAGRGGFGYVQRPYVWGGHEYAHRTYFFGGRVYDRYYSPFSFHGVSVAVYAPFGFYHPAYYGWAYHPWAAPISFSWGFTARPWYGYYGAYFAPYPVYRSPSFWLTDYLISQSLMDAYRARAASAAALDPAYAMTPDVKDLIAEEVQRQIAIETAEAKLGRTDPEASGIAHLFSDHVQHVFVAGKDLDVTDAGGSECALSEGDALQLTGPPAGDANVATLVVLSSKGGKECGKGDNVMVAFADLQDMQNHMRETIDQGLGELQTKQGQGGLPALPPAAQGAPVKAEFAASAPPPEADVAAQIKEQAQAADAAEKQVVAETAQPAAAAETPTTPAAPAAPAPAPGPAQVSVGQSIDEVIAALGQPTDVLKNGNKQIYVYKDFKVTFKNGKVSDVR